MNENLKKFGKHWGMRYLDTMDIDSIDISSEAVDIIAKIIKEFPNQKIKILTLVGDTYKGNVLFNFIVNELLEANSITYKCKRIGVYDDLLFRDGMSFTDCLLLDNFNLEYLTDRQKGLVLQYFELAFDYCNLIVINISKERQIDNLPDELIDIFKNSPMVKIS